MYVLINVSSDLAFYLEPFLNAAENIIRTNGLIKFHADWAEAFDLDGKC